MEIQAGLMEWLWKNNGSIAFYVIRHPDNKKDERRVRVTAKPDFYPMGMTYEIDMRRIATQEDFDAAIIRAVKEVEIEMLTVKYK